MSLEADFVLLGTGIAPLIAAQSLTRQGHSVLVLNPDHDFFRENSELPLAPLVSSSLATDEGLQSLQEHRIERAREILAPEFPGALESWFADAKEAKESQAFQDVSAPFLRARQWNWVVSQADEPALRFLDRGWKPQVSQGLVAARRFPGMNWRKPFDESLQTIALGRLVDVDLERYRNGVLEFVQSRISAERLLTSVSGLEIHAQSVRFFHQGVAKAAVVRRGAWVFWTPRVTSWLQKHAARVKQDRLMPSAGLRGWEEWSIRSREPVDLSRVGFSADAVAWARFEGVPREPVLELNVLMPSNSAKDLAGAESFLRLTRFLQGFLNWDRFRIRDLKTRATLDLPAQEWRLEGGGLPVRVMSGCEGSLVGVVERVLRFARQEDS
ncbi:MAG: hypothetical protein RJB38_1886 [Pseudomonadota bacterium]|jgi:hypothetical protein